MRKNIVAGNWKMNKTYAEAKELMAQLLEYKKNNTTNCEVYIAPPALYLTTAKEVFKNGEVGVFSQDVSEYASGAYTGEISVDMLYLLMQTEVWLRTQKEELSTEKPTATPTEK